MRSFEEIAIDEYQDSNLVQEYILTSVSRGNNIFMVGDVKQSIYRFRQARPELFLEKYSTYSSCNPTDHSYITIADNIAIIASSIIITTYALIVCFL